MTRESKGKQVKTFKHWVPQPDATKAEDIIKVYFEADEGTFVIYLPEHITPSVQGLDCYQQQVRADGPRIDTHRGQVRSKIIDSAINLYKTALNEYEASIKLQRGVKVIRVHFQKNLAYRNDRPHAFRGGPVAVGGGFGEPIGFTGTPALHLNFEVLWQVNDVLYRKNHHAAWGDRPAYDTMEFAGRIEPDSKKTTVIPWTQEREDFLAGIVEKLVELGWLLTDFFGDFETNINHAIASGSRFLAIAPPKQEDELPSSSPTGNSWGPSTDSEGEAQ